MNPPAYQPPTEPFAGYWPDAPLIWQEMFSAMRARSHRGGVDVAFVGDSITQGWDPMIWFDRFAPLNAANYGIGGDKTSQVLYRLQNGMFDGISPKVVVVLIGVNNLWDGLFTPVEIASGIDRVVDEILTRAPVANVLLLGVLPTSPLPTDPLRKQVTAINEILAAKSWDSRVQYRDITDSFVESDGSISPDIMPDYLHLSEEGYEIFADVIHPWLLEFLAG